MNITAIINACSGDRNFLIEHVKALRDSCAEIKISYSTHLYNGQLDDENKWELIKAALKPYDVHFITFGKIVGSPLGQNTARWQGYCSGIRTEWTLFMDADEIFEKDKFDEWVATNDIKRYNVLNFSAYFYSLHPKYRACITEEEIKDFTGDRNDSMSGPNFSFRHAHASAAGLLVKTDLITQPRIFRGPERWQFLKDSDIPAETKISANPCIISSPESDIAKTMLYGERILHHYAYVRSKEQMIRKISGYAHQNDKNWYNLINEYYKEDFIFDPKKHREIYGYVCKEIIPVHNILPLGDFDKLYE